jgi:hypothetical protein
MTDSVISLIDNAVSDWQLASVDAMRWTPDPPPRPEDLTALLRARQAEMDLLRAVNDREEMARRRR